MGKELDRLEAASILEKVSYSEWAAPIVTVTVRKGMEHSASVAIIRSLLIRSSRQSSITFES